MSQPAESARKGAATPDAQVDAAADRLSQLSVEGSSSNASSASAPSVSLAAPPAAPARAPRPRITLESLAAQIASGSIRRIVVLTGAGVSTSAGIPDFRSPTTGLYANLQKYNLPRPTAVFELDYFRRNPAPFFMLAKELYPGEYRPTPTHHFIRALEERGLLLRNLTQNIDGLELEAGLSPARLVQAHGGFSSAACIDCHRTHEAAHVKDAVMNDRIPRCRSESCKGLVKPNIVFFGEGLPPAFAQSVSQDLPQAELLIVMGSSLTVQPFASLIGRVPKSCPRILINLEAAGEGEVGDEDEDEEETLQRNPHYATISAQLANCSNDKMRPLLQAMVDQLRSRILAGSDGGFNFRRGDRDVFLRSDCDTGVRRFAQMIGSEFARRLEELVEDDRRKHPKGPEAPKAGMVAAAAEAEKVAAVIAESAGAVEVSQGERNKGASEADARDAKSGSGAAAATASSTAAASSAAPAPSAASSGTAAPSASSSASSDDTSSSSASPPLAPLAVGFDFDHTLGMDHGLELNALRLLAADLGRKEQASRDSFTAHMQKALQQFRDEHTSMGEMIQAFAREVEVDPAQVESPPLLDRWKTHCCALAERTTPIDGALDLLAWLRSQRIPVAILTNGWSPLQRLKVEAALGALAPPRDAFLVSDTLGSAKPSPQAFQAMRRCAGFEGMPPARVWYVGDNPAGDVGGALAAGLKAVWFDWEKKAYPEGQAPPTHTVHTLDEIKTIIQEAIRKQQAETGSDTQAAAPPAQEEASSSAKL